MVWFLIIVAYMAPADSVDWNGPWKAGVARTNPMPFETEERCREEAIAQIGRIHQDMLAPMRYRCVGVEADLPKDAPR